MIDLHCHILPGIDDGAAALEDAVGMARQADSDRIAGICATPHVRRDHDVRIAELPGRVAEVNAELVRRGALTRVLRGGEVAEPILGGLSDEELGAVSLGGGGRWILLEPPAGPLDQRTVAAVDKLRARGFSALIAHPERHLAEDLVPRLVELVDRGALVQATAAGFTDPGIRPGMLELARRGLVHVLGSDSHSPRHGRPVRLSDAIDVLRAVQPPGEHLNWIAETAPAMIVSGEPVLAPFPAGPPG